MKNNKTSSIYQKICLSLLSNQKKGILKVTLPDGRILYFGDIREYENKNILQIKSGGVDSKNLTYIENKNFTSIKKDKFDKKNKTKNLEIISNNKNSILKNESLNKNKITASIKINDIVAFKKAVLYGDVGFGEAYVDGDWDTDNITNFIKWWILNIDNSKILSGSKMKITQFAFLNFFKALNLLIHNFRANTKKGSKKNILDHYDLGNNFYKIWLDKTMTYSSGKFSNSKMSLADAQIEKYDSLCKKLRLEKSDNVLEIGSGWGGFAVYAVKKYGVNITTITISDEQYNYANERFKKEGVSNKAKVLLKDYRDMKGTFNKIVSIEMLEAVGHKYFKTYFAKCNELLAKNGLLALQVITAPNSRYKQYRKSVDWIQKHIFPGSLLPSLYSIDTAISETGDMQLIDAEEFGFNYAKTLATWRDAFNKNFSKIRSLGFNENFIRKWNYYLSYCEAGFAMRNIYVMQLLYSRPNNLSY